MTGVLGTAGATFAAIGREIIEIDPAGRRARLAMRVALSVVAAVTLAQMLRLNDVWWAGISGFLASQATRPDSLQRSLLRVIGTLVGAALGCAAMALFAYDRGALLLVLLVCGTVGVTGMSVANHGYAWLLGGLTANMIVMMSMNDPALTPFVAFDRIAGVTVGCVAAVTMALTLAPRADDLPPAPPTPGWRDLLGAQWPAVEHGLRAGLTVMAMPLVWDLLGLPTLSQMAITAIAVMGVPVTGQAADAVGAAVLARGVQRIIGCLTGGLFGLLLLSMPVFADYPVWLVALFGGVWLAAWLQTSTRGTAYAAVQAAMVFIMTVVQGDGPAQSIMPGIERFVGILGGLMVLLVIGLMLWPVHRAAPPGAPTSPPG
ncbi:MAG: FUSC family protein [Proteobacteria bacterium]|nr:FUSC family protein [Pseudomonadota bacterium]